MYKLPETLSNDIAKLAILADGYAQKRIEAVQFKAYRVPMGIYEQRKDGSYMSRIRTTGGVITPDQFLGIIDIAKRHGSDLLHITTRQEIQIQNIEIGNLEPILYDLQKIELSTKGGGGNTVRNIIVSEDSGLSADEKFDTTPYAIELTSKLIAETDSYLLPRKLKIAFASDDSQIGHAAVNDIGLVAKIKDGEKGFLVYAGGGGGSKPTVGWLLFDFIPAGELYIVAEAVKKFFSEHGNRKNRSKARLRYIFYKLGEGETIRLLKQYYEEAKKTEQAFVLEEGEEERPSHDYEAPENISADSEEYAAWKKRYVKSQKQPGYSSILIPVSLGNIPLGDENWLGGFKKLLELAARFGKHTVRFTTTQSIRLRNIPDAALPELYSLVKDIIPQSHVPVLINNIVSCTGADTCRLGLCFSKGLAKAIRKELGKTRADLDGLSNAHINVSGCPNSCGQHFWADIGFTGRVLRTDRVYPGYQVCLAADRELSPSLAEPIGTISARNAPEFVRRLIEEYLNGGAANLTFTQYLKADGKQFALKLIDEYKNIPSFADDKNYYYDWDAETPFSVTGKGTAECSAGLFDMIEFDIDIINNAKAALKDETDAAKINGLLYSIVYSASRMLLVTRGADPKTSDDVFNLFIEKFVDAGIVEEKFRGVVSAARDKGESGVENNRDDILALADKMTELYKNMDDTLQFKVAEGAKPAAEGNGEQKAAEASAAKVKDLRGVTCPMNFVQTKIQLSTMKSGEVLEILLDDGPPIENVPGSVRAEGHEILGQVKTDNHWKVTIKKK